MASPEDLEFAALLEGWTNDRLSAELGMLFFIPKEEWVLGSPQATPVMAAFCHPYPTGSRFNGPHRGAWYAGFNRETAILETVYHRTKELEEIGVFDTHVQMREYIADFEDEFHDIRESRKYKKYHNPHSYAESQSLAAELLSSDSNGIIYRSVRHSSGTCLACFRPKLVLNVRQGAHFEYRWEGKRDPIIKELRTEN